MKAKPHAKPQTAPPQRLSHFLQMLALLGPRTVTVRSSSAPSPCAQRACTPGHRQAHILLGANLLAFSGLESENLGLASDTASSWLCDQAA